jgi:putative oxygen-independent coproporphyrinogen III oxidase
VLWANTVSSALSLYIHWPFCLSNCPYCDFNSHVAEKPIDEARWRRALLAEMDHFAGETMADQPLKSIFFGGGTPSTMAPETTAALIEAAKLHWRTSKGLEISLEANPTSVEAGKLKDFAAAGVNRLSLGVQSFSDKSLKFLGREHSAAEAIAAIDLTRASFERHSFDLIYGLPEQSTEMWKNELNKAIEMATGHLSLYQLSIEAGTQFFADKVSEADPEMGANLYALTHELTTQAGLNRYEISNYAHPGEECQHNVAIWRGGDYVGIGPGAHGRMSKGDKTHALYQIYNPARWLEKVENEGHATAKQTPLTTNGRAEEIIMTGLRLSEGIEAERFKSFLNSNALLRLKEDGFLVMEDGILRTTDTGQLCLNSVLGELLSV